MFNIVVYVPDDIETEAPSLTFRSDQAFALPDIFNYVQAVSRRFPDATVTFEEVAMAAHVHQSPLVRTAVGHDGEQS